MIQFIAGAKGVGKTKRLIEMANKSVKTTDGDIVFIDDDKRHIYDLHYDIRFVETVSFPLSDRGMFIGFICGILSQNSDIKEIYIDGLTNIIGTIGEDDLVLLTERLGTLSEKNGVDFIISVNWEVEKIPVALAGFLI